MEEPLCVLYYGPDAAALEQRWETTDRPFALSAFDDARAARAFAAETAVDALVCSGPDAMAVVDDVRDAVGHVPVVVPDDVETDAVAALAEGVTHCLSVADRDRIEVIESLDPVVTRYRDERRERTMLDSLLDNIPLSVYFKDRQSRFLRVSDAMTSMMGDPYIESPDGVRYYAPADIVGTTDFDVFPNHLAEPATQDDRSVMENEEPIDRVEHAYGPAFDGSYVATSKRAVVRRPGRRRRPRRRHARHQRTQAVRTPARTPERAARTVRQGDQSRPSQPLEVAKSRLRFAREECESEHFDAIDRSLDRMDDLIADVLTITRYGETVEDPDLVDVATVAGDAWDVIDSPGGDARGEHQAGHPRRHRPAVPALREPVPELGRTRRRGPGRPHRDRRRPPHKSGFYVADDGVGIPRTSASPCSNRGSPPTRRGPASASTSSSPSSTPTAGSSRRSRAKAAAPASSSRTSPRRTADPSAVTTVGAARDPLVPRRRLQICHVLARYLLVVG